MCMDPQGLALPAFKEIEARSTVFAASVEALLPMTAWRTNMLIYPSSWGWRHKTSIGMFKQGYYPTFCIAPLFLAPGERLEALTAFSKLAFRLPRWEYVNAHMQHAHRSVVCFRAISVATDVSSHSPRLFHY